MEVNAGLYLDDYSRRRQDFFASKIQATWRGHEARKRHPLPRATLVPSTDDEAFSLSDEDDGHSRLMQQRFQAQERLQEQQRQGLLAQQEEEHELQQERNRQTERHRQLSIAQKQATPPLPQMPPPPSLDLNDGPKKNVRKRNGKGKQELGDSPDRLAMTKEEQRFNEMEAFSKRKRAPVRRQHQMVDSPSLQDSPNVREARSQTSLAKRFPGVVKKDWKRPNTVAGEKGVRFGEVKRATEVAEQDVIYWQNRVKMLRTEMEKTVTKIETAKRANDIFSVSAAMNEKTRLALEEQQLEAEKRLAEQRERNLIQKQTIKISNRETLASHYVSKKCTRELVKLESENNERIIDQMKYEILEYNVKRKEFIQQQKIVGLLKRVKDTAVKAEEVSKRYDDKVQEALLKEQEKQSQAMQMIKESAIMMQHLKQLKEEQAAVQAQADPSLVRFR
eukprot:NODE_148_length_1553_cov_1112.425532_g85_i0.p1 GENE.NODE_148_length_1553_cov_1112.425532_g85_i0~~NODE_148_length_1553_cov_1112.425532_g85_i0.p1  ORF type:complete len:448 (-),score=106.67 NODE_148_length_1553_cov_1112.425532_g85_i0:146-1489(-)